MRWSLKINAQLSLIMVGLFHANLCLAIDPLVANPRPFRGDEIQGRQFNYSNDSFLHRISYQPYSDWLADWQQGFLASVGSISSREFYSSINIQKRLPLAEHFEVEFRVERGEDFDARYQNVQIGLGYRLNSQWTLSVLSDVEADKKTDDLQLEVRYRDNNNNSFRAAVVATDVAFNKKQTAQIFSQQPYTYFVESNWSWSDKTRVHAYLNYNSPLTLDMMDLDQIFHYRNLRGELAVVHQVSSRTSIAAQLIAETGRRQLISSNNIAEFERHYQSASVEFNVKPPAKNPTMYRGYWLGLRAIEFDESDSQYASINDSFELTRQEIILYGGLHYQLYRDVLFSPVLFIDSINNDHLYQLASQLNQSDKQTLIKLNLPFEFSYGAGASLIFNTTIEVDQKNFGGFNLQLNIPF